MGQRPSEASYFQRKQSPFWLLGIFTVCKLDIPIEILITLIGKSNLAVGWAERGYTLAPVLAPGFTIYPKFQAIRRKKFIKQGQRTYPPLPPFPDREGGKGIHTSDCFVFLRNTTTYMAW
jgi:hypothetical protein